MSAFLGGARFGRAALLAAAFLSLAFALITPPFQMPDEHAHFLRAYGVSRGEFVAPAAPRVPADVLEYVVRYPDGPDFPRVARPFAGAPPLPSARPRYLAAGLAATATYFPLVYAPAAVAVRAVRAAGGGPPEMLYAARLSSVLIFIAALALAVRLAPEWGPLILAVALLPMTLQQSAAVSADPVLIAFSLAGFALAMRARDRALPPGQLALIAAFFVLWSTCKFSIWVLPLAWLAIARSVPNPARRLLWAGAVLAAAFAGFAAWQHAGAPAVEAQRIARLADDVDTAANVRDTVAHPDWFLRTAAASLRAYGSQYVGSFAGEFGWTLAGPPVPVRILYLAALLFAALATGPAKPLARAEKFVLLATALTAAVLVFSGLILFCAPAGALREGRAVWGVQGRYFIPFALPALALLRLTRRIHPAVVECIVLAAALLCGVASLRFVWSLYYL